MFLDLGCGTGEQSIPAANYFGNVVSVDPDKKMLREGTRKARGLAINNIEWHKKGHPRLK
jgi:ubiquinone/menaquinone biosynthesis C-methylase UbiE